MAGKPDVGALILGMGDKPKPKEKAAPKSSSLSAAKALLSAVEAKDAEAVDEALKLHYDMCKEADYDAEE